MNVQWVGAKLLAKAIYIQEWCDNKIVTPIVKLTAFISL